MGVELGGKLKRGAPKLDKGEESGVGKDETLVTRSVVQLGGSDDNWTKETKARLKTHFPQKSQEETSQLATRLDGNTKTRQEHNFRSWLEGNSANTRQ